MLKWSGSGSRAEGGWRLLRREEEDGSVDQEAVVSAER